MQAWDGRGMDKFPRKGEREYASDEDAPPEAPTPAVRQLTEKQFYDEINYHRAEKMTKKMLDAGLITSEEHDRILAEARKIFVPFLAELL